MTALAAEFINRYSRPRKRSWREDARVLNKDVLPALGDRLARDITRGDVRALLDTITGRSAPIQANRTLACIRKMFTWAVEQDICRRARSRA